MRELVLNCTELVVALIRTTAGSTEARGAPPEPPAGGPSWLHFAWASLTPTELIIAELVTENRTYREIAALLYLSPHTSSPTSRHIFCKPSGSPRVAS